MWNRYALKKTLSGQTVYFPYGYLSQGYLVEGERELVISTRRMRFLTAFMIFLAVFLAASLFGIREQVKMVVVWNQVGLLLFGVVFWFLNRRFQEDLIRDLPKFQGRLDEFPRGTFPPGNGSLMLVCVVLFLLSSALNIGLIFMDGVSIQRISTGIFYGTFAAFYFSLYRKQRRVSIS